LKWPSPRASSTTHSTGWPHHPTAGIHAGPREASSSSGGSSCPYIASSRTNTASSYTYATAGAPITSALAVALGISGLHRPR
jgi:hypothetical protein